MIPDATLNQIQERADIVEIVSSHVQLRRSGRSFKACCPFHNEKTPSFMVNPEKQIFHCFGCGVGGNVFSFLMKIERKDFREVVEELAERLGVEIPKDKPVDSEATKRVAALVKANESAAEFYRRVLATRPDAECAREYLRKRGIHERTIEDFKIGFAPDAWSSFFDAVKNDVAPAALEKAGLVMRNKEGGFYDRFRKRVVFPILDAKGVSVAFGARVMDDSVPKYLNSPETEVYVKGRHLYALFQARKTIRDEDRAVVVEGYMDVIACHQAGVTNVVASLGTALTPDQVRLIKRHTRNVVMLYDADKAGEAATLRGLELFLDEEMDVKVVRLPEGHDPDSFIRDHGVDEFREELNRAKDLFEYKLALLRSRHKDSSIESRVKIANEMVSLFARVKNEILKSAWMKELSKELAIPEAALAAEMKKRPGTDRDEKRGAAVPKEEQADAAVSPIERILLALMLDSSEFAARARAELRPEDFRHPTVRRLVQTILSSDEPASPAKLVSVFKDDADATAIVSGVVAEGEKWDRPDDKKKSFSDCLLKVKRARLAVERESLRRELGDAERQGDKNRISRLMVNLEELNKRDRQIDEKKQTSE